MAHLVHVQQEWDFAEYGSVDITWTDDSGGHSITAISTGKYRHLTTAADSLTHPDGGVAIANTANAYFAAYLQTQMDAATTETITVAYSNTTNRYTITCTGAVFTVTWGAGAESRLKQLLGYSGNISSSPAVATLAPYYTIEPGKNAITGWTEPEAVPDAVTSRVTSSADLITVGPARIPYQARVEFAFESDAQTIEQYETRFCWQRFWNDAGRNARMCYLMDVDPPAGATAISWAFRLKQPTFDRSTHRRERPELRNRWRVSLDMLLRGRF